MAAKYVPIKVKVKGKVIPALFFVTKHHAIKACCGVEV
jgi:hypothetical protein